MPSPVPAAAPAIAAAAALAIAGWLAVGALLAAVSRWPALARRYPGGPRPAGPRLRGQVSGVGVVPEHNVTGLVLAAAGLYLYSHPLFRFSRPPALLPWAAVRHRRARRLVWQRWHTLDLAGVTTLRVSDRAWQAIAPHVQAGGGVLLPNDALKLPGSARTLSRAPRPRRARTARQLNFRVRSQPAPIRR